MKHQTLNIKSIRWVAPADIPKPLQEAVDEVLDCFNDARNQQDVNSIFIDGATIYWMFVKEADKPKSKRVRNLMALAKLLSDNDCSLVLW